MSFNHKKKHDGKIRSNHSILCMIFFIHVGNVPLDNNRKSSSAKKIEYQSIIWLDFISHNFFPFYTWTILIFFCSFFSFVNRNQWNVSLYILFSLFFLFRIKTNDSLYPNLVNKLEIFFWFVVAAWLCFGKLFRTKK